MERIEGEPGEADMDDEHVLEVTLGEGREVKEYARRTWGEYRLWMRENPGLIHIVSAMDRVGVGAWSDDLERRYFWPPGSPFAARFHYHMAGWKGILWQVVTIPVKQIRFAERVAAKFDLRLLVTIPWVRVDGNVTTMASFGEARFKDPVLLARGSFFPIRSAAVRTLEYVPDSATARAAGAGLTRVLKDMEAQIIMNGPAGGDAVDRN